MKMTTRRSRIRNRIGQDSALEPGQAILPPAQRVASEAVRPQNDPWLQQVLTPEEMAAVGEVRQAQQGLRPRMHSQHEREQKAVFQIAVAQAEQRKAVADPLPNSRIRRKRNGGANPGEVFLGGRATPLSEAEMIEKGMMLPPAKVEVQNSLINGETMTWQPNPAAMAQPGGRHLVNIDGVNPQPEELDDRPVITQEELEAYAAAQAGGYDEDYEGAYADEEEVQMSFSTDPLARTLPGEPETTESKTVPIPPFEPLQKKTVKKSAARKNKTTLKTKGKNPAKAKSAGENMADK